MLSQCVESRATALVEAASAERLPGLHSTIQQSRAEMNSRGMLASSTYVLEVCRACEVELRERAKIVWEAIRRAHESCGSATSEDLYSLFRTLLEKEKVKLAGTQEQFAGSVVRQLQNKSLLQLQSVSEIHAQLLSQYDAEIAIYLDNLKLGTGKTLYERLKAGFLNNKLVASLVLVVVAIVGLGSFAYAIGRLSGFINDATGTGQQANPAVQGTLRDKAAQRP